MRIHIKREDCGDGNMERLNELAHLIEGWDERERTCLTEAARQDGTDDFEGGIWVARHLDGTGGTGRHLWEDFLSIQISCNGQKKWFPLPFTERDRESPSYRTVALQPVTGTSGYLRELPRYLPPGITVLDLDRVAGELSRTVKEGEFQLDKLYAILEAGLPEDVGEACHIIQAYDGYQYFSLMATGSSEITGLAMAHHHMAHTSFGYVSHPDVGSIRPLTGGRDIRLYSPLTVTVYWDSQDGMEPEVLSGGRLVPYKDMIGTAIREHLPATGEGLEDFVDNRLLRRKVGRMMPGAGIYGGQPWGTCDLTLRCPLTEAEQKELVDDWRLQMKEGWGMTLMEYPIWIDGGEMHIGFWDMDYGRNLSIRTGEGVKGGEPSVMVLS